MIVFVLLVFLSGILLIDPLLLDPKLYWGSYILILVTVIVEFSIRRKHDKLLSSIVLIILMTGLLTANFADYFWNPFEFFFVLVSASMIFYVLGIRDSTTIRTKILVFFAFIGGFYFFTALINYSRQLNAFGFIGIYRFPSGPMVNPNVAGRILGLCGFIVFCLARINWVKVALGLPLLLMSLMTGSRGVILSALATAFFIGVYKFRERLNIRLILSSAVVLVVLLFALIGFPGKVTDYQRLKLISESLAMFQDHTLTGVGMWNFGLAYPEYSLDSRWQRHPHNLLLHIVTAFGLIGVLSLGVCIWLGATNYKFCFAHFPVIFLILHEMVDTMLWIPGILFLVSIYLGYLWTPERKQFNIRVITVCSTIVMLIAGTWMFRNSLSYANAYHQASEGNWKKASKKWRKGRAAYNKAHLSVSAIRRDELDQALKNINEALQINPMDSYYFFLKAEILKSMGRIQSYRNTMRKLRDRDPNDVIQSKGKNREREDISVPNEPNYQEIKANPLKPKFYLPIVKRTISRGNCNRAREQITILRSFNRRTRGVNRKLAQFESSCDKMISHDLEDDDAGQKLTDSSDSYTSVRPQFHRFFYRRAGLDHAISN